MPIINQAVESAELNINPNCASFEDLFSGKTGSSQYEHLQIIMSRNNNHEFGQEYLYVSTSAFGKVKLVDIDLIDNHLYIELQDCNNGLYLHNSINIDDKEFKFLLISWQDIRKMVMDESQSKFNNQDLLEFEY
jgi:hypothetical protein